MSPTILCALILEKSGKERIAKTGHIYPAPPEKARAAPSGTLAQSKTENYFYTRLSPRRTY